MFPSKRLHALVILCSFLVIAAGAAFAADQHDAEPHDGTEHAQPPAGLGDEHPIPEDLHEVAAEEHATHSAVPHLQNVVGLIAADLTDDTGHPTEAAKFLKAWVDPIFSLFVALVLAVFFISVGRNLRDRDPTRTQMFAETVVGGLYNMFEQVLGDQARRFTPYLGTLFLFILLNNWMGLVPLGHASTSSFANTTIGLGLLTFFYVQYIGIKENGLGGYLYHFAGQPKSGIEWGFAILIFPLEVMGELIKPISLSLRLFGNIFGEDTLVAVMVLLGTVIMYSLTGSKWVPGLPLHFPFYFLGLLASTVQALVFTILSTIYIALMLPHHDHAEAEAPGH